MANEPAEHVVFGVGRQFWYDEGAIRLINKGCPIGDYAGRHACGDGGDAAESPEEVLNHASMCQADTGEITSAYLLPGEEGLYLCFTTIHEKETTYVYTRK